MDILFEGDETTDLSSKLWLFHATKRQRTGEANKRSPLVSVHVGLNWHLIYITIWQDILHAWCRIPIDQPSILRSNLYSKKQSLDRTKTLQVRWRRLCQVEQSCKRSTLTTVFACLWYNSLVVRMFQRRISAQCFATKAEKAGSCTMKVPLIITCLKCAAVYMSCAWACHWVWQGPAPWFSRRPCKLQLWWWKIASESFATTQYSSVVCSKKYVYGLYCVSARHM